MDRQREHPIAWQALAWCAVGTFALLILRTLNRTVVPVFVPTHHALHLSYPARAVLAVLLALPIGWVRRKPVAVLGVLLAEPVVLAAFRLRSWPFLLVTAILLGYLAATRSPRDSALAAGGALLAWYGHLPFLNPWVFDDIGEASTVLALVVTAWAIGSSIRLRRVYDAAVRERLAERAVAAERLRIARELHDMVAHSIGVIAIQAGAASRVVETQPAGARKAVSAIELTSRETLAGLRRMLGALRRADADHAESTPPAGLEEVDRLAERTAGAGLRVDVLWRGQRRPLPPEIDLAAFRIIQESVTNAVRHSGSRRCQVSVDYREAELAIEVLDGGHGTRPAPTATAGTGFGLVGMRERVALLNGQFSAGSRPEGGFRVAARLPA
ncbi:signal transduction histidine kinase [Kitasatospora sp. GAS204A]|uniref:sensor histidine kinase n=1 Tax=unclassified Kitasatospora TaxID=2633591 RepID=UPI002475A435|nr:sensor histidine kinase [Kitasatospora sp. GAS204B]MDH6118686.1 signal transduction histidine kinase [Kitasatospora sp. GAS204B]